MTTRRVIILGSTGSIGTQALGVVEHVNALFEQGRSAVRLEVVGLAAGANTALLGEQAARFGVRHVALWHGAEAARLDGLRVRLGEDAAERLVHEVACDVVLAAIVGVAGLPATLAAVQLGRDVALANKETLVAAGALVIPAAKSSGSKLLPVDSEHAGVWQALARAHPTPPPLRCGEKVARVTLTASGGAFREWPRDRMARATPQEALKHPTWRMGRKVTIDSASLMNKALELIEAHYLFGLPASKLDAVIHPQSIVHALVEYADGSVVAQMASPDMRLPIMAALTHPHVAHACSPRLGCEQLSGLTFEGVDHDRYPAIRLGLTAIERGETAGAILNAANEAAVEAFLAGEGRLPFGRIADLVRETVEAMPVSPVLSLADVFTADATARAHVARLLAQERAV